MLDLFPEEAEDEAVLIDEDEEQEEIPWEYGVDFDTGMLTGEIVRGAEAVAVWVWNALKTPRFRIAMHSDDFGSELEDIIGETYSEDYTESRAKKAVEDAVLNIQGVEEIEDFECLAIADMLIIVFNLITSYGEEEIAVGI